MKRFKDIYGIAYTIEDIRLLNKTYSLFSSESMAFLEKMDIGEHIRVNDYKIFRIK